MSFQLGSTVEYFTPLQQCVIRYWMLVKVALTQFDNWERTVPAYGEDVIQLDLPHKITVDNNLLWSKKSSGSVGLTVTHSDTLRQSNNASMVNRFFLRYSCLRELNKLSAAFLVWPTIRKIKLTFFKEYLIALTAFTSYWRSWAPSFWQASLGIGNFAKLDELGRLSWWWGHC